ncbi:unnamed protein product, partial [Arabidopsis halleri]
EKKTHNRLRVKSQPPKGKHRYSTRSRSSLQLCDDDESSLLLELEKKVGELSNRVLKLEKRNKAIIFNRTRKLSSRYASRTKRKHPLKVPVQSLTPQDDLGNQEDCVRNGNFAYVEPPSGNDSPMANNNDGVSN